MQKTLKCLTNLIENLQPESLPGIKNDFSACFHTYKNMLKVLPPEINMSYENWCRNLNLDAITEELKRIINMSDIFGTLDVSDETCQKIRGLKILAEVFDHPTSYSRIWMDMLIEKENQIRHVLVADILSIAEKCLSCSEFEDLLDKNVDFVVKYLRVYFERVLVTEDVVKNTYLFLEVLKYFCSNYKNYEKHYDRVIYNVEKVCLSVSSLDTIQF